MQESLEDNIKNVKICFNKFIIEIIKVSKIEKFMVFLGFKLKKKYRKDLYMKCQVCNKKTRVMQTTDYGSGHVKRLRVCSDNACEALPFYTYEKRGKHQKVVLQKEENKDG